ncbi:hypothetical protein IC235_09880 [Hymenobacter sp. BT664]|uniref:Uncharacterized protein n=1 Tax=Hymenobacter montanus TaxID=2771359 RepID=A0A927BCD2_9BACT|nr:hypothetical protein [Hymenobacter montanus]MBD2768200.1 hypothetical protein [Hymenobacter montanus]
MKWAKPKLLTWLLLTVGTFAKCQSRKKVIVVGNKEYTMNATHKNLSKIAKNPFFTQFTKEQLKWLDAHTEEFAVDQNEEIPLEDNVYWILLYGAWEAQADKGPKKAARSTDESGKWFGKIDFLRANPDVRLIAKRDSYVLRVSVAVMEQMQQLGYPVREQLAAGISEHRANFQ